MNSHYLNFNKNNNNSINNNNKVSIRNAIVDLQIGSDQSLSIVIGDDNQNNKQKQKYIQNKQSNKNNVNNNINSISNIKLDLKNGISFQQMFKNRIMQKAQQKNSTINLDNSLNPSLHTRSKGQVRNYNEFIRIEKSQKQQKQFKQNKYQFSNTNNKPKQLITNYMQTKLKVINLDQMPNLLPQQIRMPKPGQSIHQPRKKPQLQKPYFSGAQYKTISANRLFQSQKQKQQRKKQKIQLKKKQKQEQQKQKQQRIKSIQNTFSNLLGLKLNNDQDQKNKNKIEKYKQDQRDFQLKNLDMLEQIQNQENFIIENQNYDVRQFHLNKRAKYGLNQIIKTYDTSNAFPFVKAILAYKFCQNLDIPSNKRIPNIFNDSQVYKKTFHYLVINQCIADLHQRMKGLQKENTEKLQIQILDISKNSNGLVQIKIRQIENNISKQKYNQISSLQKQKKHQESTFLLKNYSMSRHRLGIITDKPFNLQNFGLKSISKDINKLSYTFLCLLKTPQSKQQLKQDVKVQASINDSDLQFILKSKKSRKAYFYDLQKLSTNIRQYLSISNIQYSELAGHIYNPKFIQTDHNYFVHELNRDCINDVLNVLHERFNQTQFQAIRQMSLRQNGIVLLQGPPGTGKTSTLLGLISAQYSYLRRIGDNRKIMICAPSNAAIDHITKRLQTQGLVTGQGEIFFPNILRLGIVETQDEDIVKCSIDHICEKKVLQQKNVSIKQSKMTTVQIREKLIFIQKQIRNLNFTISKYNKYKNQEQSQTQLKKLKNQLQQKNSQFLRLEGLLYSCRKDKIISKKIYQQYQKKLMKQAEIIISTLSSSGTQKVQQIRGQIACLIVDQAAQATEPSLLIALQTGVNKVMLIGDPYQLPATTMSSDSNITLFNRSLFERFIDADIRPYFLNIQYRMTPLIRSFPSRKFYKNRLTDGSNILNRVIPQKLECFPLNRSVIFIDVKQGKQSVIQNSYCNHKQVFIVKRLISKLQLLKFNLTIGVITPYQAQRKLLMKEILPKDMNNQQRNNKNKNDSNKSKNEKNHNRGTKSQSQSQKQSEKQNKKQKGQQIMINTIDSFQGQQKDIIIISTVRSNDKKAIGFLVDQRRINVSVTRAKHAMIIIGNGDTLGSNQIWHEYLQQIEKNKLYFQINTRQEEDKLFNNINKKDYFNQIPIRRRFYNQNELTFDPRKIKRKQIQQNDFKKKTSNKNQKNPQQNNQRNYSNLEVFKQPQRIVQQGHKSSNSILKINISSQKYQNQRQKLLQMQNYYNNSKVFFNKNRQKQQQRLPSFAIKNNNSYKNHFDFQNQDNYRAYQLIQKKRKQQQQNLLFQAAKNRLKQVQRQKANDQYYKFLFQ